MIWRGKNVGKKMINILNPSWFAPMKGGRQKCKVDIIYFQNILIIQGKILDDV